MIKVCKFGGTSMANKSAIEQVKNIIFSDENRKFVVVSAPGKRFKEDTKITDCLYSVYDELVETGKIDCNFKFIEDRFYQIVELLNLKIDVKTILEKTKLEIIENKSKEFTASRGEYLSALVMADYLGFEFVDAKDLIRFNKDGSLNEEYTNDLVKEKLKNVEKAVIPGFYGANSLGKVVTFSRGGSDITGSIIARGVKANIYENWTDVSGFLVCDPRIVANAQTIDMISYKELRELSYMGASVLHSEAVFPVRKENIPINIRNTFRPEDKGTMIVPNEEYILDANKVVTGITGKKGFTVIVLEKSSMNHEVGFVRKVLSVLENHGLCVEHIPSGIDTLSVVLETAQLTNGILDTVISEIKSSVNPDKVTVNDSLSLVAVVGHGMKSRVGTASKILSALAKEGINLVMIDQGLSELNIIVGIDTIDYEKCIKAIYQVFFQEK